MRPTVYDLHASVAEIYDRIETKTADVALLRRLIGSVNGLRILEPFCGTGRVLVPLARDGHTLVGLDNAAGMLARARAKLSALPAAVQERVTLHHVDVLHEAWPQGFDLVILAGNCLYELGTPEDQARVIACAAAALRPGGHLFVDNDHMEGDLDPSWYRPAEEDGVFPTGRCADGTCLESRWSVIWYNTATRLIAFRRRTRITRPDGTVEERETVQQKHPPSAEEVAGWLEAAEMTTERRMGDYDANCYTNNAPRAIFWARKDKEVKPDAQRA